MVISVTAITATIPPRARMLETAVESLMRQDCRPIRHIIEVDHAHEGPAIVRNRALAQVDTDWVFALDDDDELYPHFVSAHLREAAKTAADVIYSTFDTDGSWPEVTVRIPESPAHLRAINCVPGMAFARTAIIQKVGGYPVGDDIPLVYNGEWHPSEDWGLWIRVADAGAKFAAFQQKTWRYSVHAGSYQGRTW